MSTIKEIFRVSRPQFLVGVLGLFLFGALWAVLLGAPLSVGRLVCGYLTILPAQLSVHFSNDYFDTDTDRLGAGTFISGGSGVLVRRPELRRLMLWIALALIAFSLSMGLLFVRRYSFPPSVILYVILANLVGWVYSAPPFRLSFRGLGELCYGFIGGFLVPTMGYLTLRAVLDRDVLFLVFPLCLYAFVTILTVQIPDMEDDRLADKRTWVARWGRMFGFTAIGVLLLAATAYFFFVPFFYPRPLPLDTRTIGFLSLLPLSVGLWGALKHPGERPLATTLATWLIVTLSAFALVTDGYLIYLVLHWF